MPTGRANYEPNSLAAHGEEGGPRECPVTGFATAHGRVEHDEQGDKLRVRAELFADHYSQARLFWKSQTDSERAHIASSFTFELSKVALEEVPVRVLANLRNVDEELATRVAAGLGIKVPAKAKAARAPIDMPPSDALSIQKNMKATIEGRTLPPGLRRIADPPAFTLRSFLALFSQPSSRCPLPGRVPQGRAYAVRPDRAHN